MSSNFQFHIFISWHQSPVITAFIPPTLYVILEKSKTSKHNGNRNMKPPTIPDNFRLCSGDLLNGTRNIPMRIEDHLDLCVVWILRKYLSH